MIAIAKQIKTFVSYYFMGSNILGAWLHYFGAYAPINWSPFISKTTFLFYFRTWIIPVFAPGFPIHEPWQWVTLPLPRFWSVKSPMFIIVSPSYPMDSIIPEIHFEIEPILIYWIRKGHRFKNWIDKWQSAELWNMSTSNDLRWTRGGGVRWSSGVVITTCDLLF